MKKCKVGDIALCIYPGYFGKKFEIIRSVPYGDYTVNSGLGFIINYENGDPNTGWVIKSLDGYSWVRNKFTGTRRETIFSACKDQWLIPIRDPDQELERIKEKELEDA